MISTTTSLASTPNPSTYGSSVSFVATITPGSGGGPTMTGTVAFFGGGVRIGSSSVSWNSASSTGQATLSYALLPAGSRSITASYSGDGNYSNSASSALTQTVNTATPDGEAFESPSPAVFGQAVTLMVTFGDPNPLLAPPTGTVTFKDGGVTIGTAAVVPGPAGGGGVNAAATLIVSTLAVGSHSITAGYPGDDNYASASYGPLTPTVNKAGSTTALKSSSNPSALCQPVTFTVTMTAVSPGAGTPTGTITFKVNGSTVGTATLVGGVASYTTSSLTAGTSSVEALYGGDGNFQSSYTGLSQTVNAAVNWVLTAAPAAPDPLQGVLVPFGPASLSPLSGGLLRNLPVDPNQHHACGCGCGCNDDNNRAGRAPLGLTYNSTTVNVLPVVLATLASDFCAAVPSQIQAQLTWNGVAQGWVTFATTGHNSGDVYALPLQVGSAVSASGRLSLGRRGQGHGRHRRLRPHRLGRHAGGRQRRQPVRGRLGGRRHAVPPRRHAPAWPSSITPPAAPATSPGRGRATPVRPTTRARWSRTWAAVTPTRPRTRPRPTSTAPAA